MQYFEHGDDEKDIEECMSNVFISSESSRSLSKQKPRAEHSTVGTHLTNQNLLLSSQHLTKTIPLSVSAPMVR